MVKKSKVLKADLIKELEECDVLRKEALDSRYVHVQENKKLKKEIEGLKQMVTVSNNKTEDIRKSIETGFAMIYPDYDLVPVDVYAYQASGLISSTDPEQRESPSMLLLKHIFNLAS